MYFTLGVIRKLSRYNTFAYRQERSMQWEISVKEKSELSETCDSMAG